MTRIALSIAIVLLIAPWTHGAESAKLKQLAAKTAEWEGKVMTVTGLISADQLGITMPHEHILIRVLGPKTDLMDEGVATEELSLYAHILDEVVPELQAAGVTDEQIKTIIVENPKRLLPFKNYAK